VGHGQVEAAGTGAARCHAAAGRDGRPASTTRTRDLFRDACGARDAHDSVERCTCCLLTIHRAGRTGEGDDLVDHRAADGDQLVD